MEALIQVMESTIAARDPYTVSHQQRVTAISCAIAQEMDLPEDRVEQLRVAATLHDLGKVAIPTELLSRPGKLSPIEFDLIKTHPQVAYNILDPINFPGDTTEIILQHHERLDGSGYPFGSQDPGRGGCHGSHVLPPPLPARPGHLHRPGGTLHEPGHSL
jgi:putative two-component system response regulator